MTIPLCSRSGDVLEPMLKEQWFLSVEKMFKECHKAVETGVLELIPKMRENLWNQYVNTVYKSSTMVGTTNTCTLKIENQKFKWFVGRNINEVQMKACEFFQTDQVEIVQGVTFSHIL